MEEVDEETRLSNPDEYTLTGSVDCSNANRELYVMKVPLTLLQMCEERARSEHSAASFIIGKFRLPAEYEAERGGSDAAADGMKRETGSGSGSRPPAGKAPATGSLVIEPKAVKPALHESNAGKESSGGLRLTALGAAGQAADVTANMPLLYDVKFKPEKPKMMIFSDDPADDTGKVRCEGRVAYECVTQAQRLGDILNVKKAIEEAALKRKRHTEVLEEEEYRKTQIEEFQARGIVESVKSRDEKRRRTELIKRGSATPMDDKWRERILQKIFKAFESHSYWATEAILDECNESKQRLNPIIKELCVYNSRGPYAGTWELKDEFKTQQQRTDKDTDIAERRRRTIENAQLKLKEKEERDAKE